MNLANKNLLTKTATLLLILLFIFSPLVSVASTKLALREGHDATNSAFVGSSGQYNSLVN
jgi:hypothetical protein